MPSPLILHSMQHLLSPQLQLLSTKAASSICLPRCLCKFGVNLILLVDFYLKISFSCILFYLSSFIHSFIRSFYIKTNDYKTKVERNELRREEQGAGEGRWVKKIRKIPEKFTPFLLITSSCCCWYCWLVLIEFLFERMAVELVQIERQKKKRNSQFNEFHLHLVIASLL